MSFTNIKVTSKNEHQKVWNLLPWYINHSLDPVEQDIVRKHVETCITCRIELNQQQRLFGKIQQIDLLQQVSQVSFARLKKRMEDQSKPSTLAEHIKPERKPKLPYQFLDFVKYTAWAAGLLLLAMPFLLNHPMNEPGLKGEYRTLASPIEGEQKSNVVRIVFADQLNPKQIEAILNGVSGHVVKGPSQNGIYEVRIGNQPANSQKVNDAISYLRQNSLVVFAEPVRGLAAAD